MISENADKIPAEKKAPVEAAVADLKSALKSGSISEIKAKQEALTKAMDAVTQGMYSQQQAGGQQQPGAGAGFGGTETEDSSASSGPKANDDGVIDADYTMMDDDKKKK
jgi:molecular chaperone DnaK